MKAQSKAMGWLQETGVRSIVEVERDPMFEGPLTTERRGVFDEIARATVDEEQVAHFG